MITENLLKLAQMFAEHNQLALATVSFRSADDGKFFASLQAEKTCTVRRAERVLGWFAANWPDDLEWPEDIPRPETGRAA